VIHVACTSNEKYMPHCAVMLLSLLRTNSNVCVHFLCDDALSSQSLSLLGRMVVRESGVFQAHSIPPGWVSGLPGLKNIPPLMWYRVFLPVLMPENEKVLYLDADTLVMGDMSELWNTQLGSNFFAAVKNVLEPEYASWPRSLGLSLDSSYANSGVLLMNLAEMRARDFHKKVADYGRNPPCRLLWPDQDALNVVAESYVRFVHPRWNCQNSLFYLREASLVHGAAAVNDATRNPGVLHFEGGLKPWHYLSRHPFRSHYLRYRRESPWPDVEIEGRSLVNMLLRPFPTPAAIKVLKLLDQFRRALRKNMLNKRSRG